jgi:hypothetical protein
MPADDSNPKHAPSVPDVTLPDDPTVRARRGARHRPDDGDAFLPDPTNPATRVTATDAESFGEEYVASATTGEPMYEEANDEVSEEEDGGPFLEIEPGDEEDVAATIGEEVSLPRPKNAHRSLPR